MKQHSTLNTHFKAVFLLLFILLYAECGRVSAQQFTVKKFSVMPNDVSAFINPVYDLNGEACAAVKVTAPADFAFSTPLGIVKRIDSVGEILLYIPKGSKQITIKHPQWGVLRNYRFPKTLESRVTYELVINQPEPSYTVKHDTIVLTKTITDTITIKRAKPKVPFRTHAMLTIAMHEHGPSVGVMLAMMRHNGLFIHAQSNLRSTGKTTKTCDKEGYITGNAIKPYYTGDTRHSNYAVTAGLIHRLGDHASLFYGAGYGRTATAWQLAESEGGGIALNNGLTHKGIAAEAGAMLVFGRLSVSASAVTIKGKQWQGVIGVGINIGKR